MSIQDPISDLLIQIKNGQNSKKKSIELYSCNLKVSIVNILKQEGYIENYEIKNGIKSKLKILLKYFQKKPVIEYIERISKPSLRIYKKKKELPKVMDGFGIAIISTSKGIMTDKDARKQNIGGEIICYIA